MRSGCERVSRQPDGRGRDDDVAVKALKRRDLEARGWRIASSPLEMIYQSNFMPKRASRGPIIVTGNRNVDPELHVIFDAALEFVRL